MPTVGKRRFPYTPGGKRAAERHRKTIIQNAVAKKKKKKTPIRKAYV